MVVSSFRGRADQAKASHDSKEFGALSFLGSIMTSEVGYKSSFLQQLHPGKIWIDVHRCPHPMD